MIKMILVAIGVIAFLIGAIDWLVGVVESHSRFLMISGAIALVVALILEQRQKNRESLTLPFMAMVVSPFDKVLTPPMKTPVLQWNPNGLTGAEVWGIIFIIVIVGLIIYMARTSIKKTIRR